MDVISRLSDKIAKTKIAESISIQFSIIAIENMQSCIAGLGLACRAIGSNGQTGTLAPVIFLRFLFFVVIISTPNN